MDDEAVLQINQFGNRCQHNKFLIDPSASFVTCGMCGEHLNPVWVLDELRKQNSRYQRHVEFLKKEAELAKDRNRCKCEKCGQMTRVVK